VVVFDRRYSRKRSASLQGLSASIENMLLAATAAGLGTCWMVGFGNDRKIREILNIPRHYSIAALVSIGYPDAHDVAPRPFREPVGQVLAFNSFSGPEDDFPTTADVDKWTIDDVVRYRRRISPIYAPRFRLAPFSLNTSSQLLSTLRQALNGRGLFREFGSILDVVTYDGVFARDLLNAWNVPANRLTVTDYFEYPLDNFKRTFPEANALRLASDHTLASNGRFDLITCVNKLELVPGPRALVRALREVTAPDALLFLTCTDPLSPLSLHKRFRQWHPVSNSYENNPLFRSGPFRFRSRPKVEQWLKESGWRIVDSGRCVSTNSTREGTRVGRSTRWLNALRSARTNWWLATTRPLLTDAEARQSTC
jgi:hypothetical protein